VYLFFFGIDVKDASSGKQLDPSNLEYFLWSLDKYTINAFINIFFIDKNDVH